MRSDSETLVPDTSVAINGKFRYFIEENPDIERIMVPQAVISEVENQANQGGSTGFAGLEELKKIRSLCKRSDIPMEVFGDRPRLEERDNVDDLIVDAAVEAGGVLVTGDRVQSDVAEARGVETRFLESSEEFEMRIEDFFDEYSMSVHLKSGRPPMAKLGEPGEFRFEKISDDPLDKEVVNDIANDIIERARRYDNCFIELDEEGASIVQLHEYRIAITRPPFSDLMEITAVRPVKKLSLDDYGLGDEIRDRLEKSVEGILVAGSPGAGKSTFVQALAEFYNGKDRVVKTMEKPRDLQVTNDITQYTALGGDMARTGDLLLLVRPDYTVFDEMRSTDDFGVFSDMRLAGVGMIGVVHASRGIDAVQRLIGRVELGMIPQVVDTIIFIDGGEVNKILALKYLVKVPSGMQEQDLARPVIEVKDFNTDSLEYEIYTYGEQIVVVPAGENATSNVDPNELLQEIRKYATDPQVEITGNQATVYVRENDVPAVLGKGGSRIKSIEDKLGLSIDVRAGKFEGRGSMDEIRPEIEESEDQITLIVGKDFSGKNLQFFDEHDEFVFSGTVGSDGTIKLGKDTQMAHDLMRANEIHGVRS